MTQVRRANALAIDWLALNVTDSGKFQYGYDLDTDQFSQDDNDLRQLMSFRLAASLSQSDDRFISVHKANLKYLFSNWYREDQDRAFVMADSSAKLGSTAMALRTLVASPLRQKYSHQARLLANGLLSAIDSAGAFRAYLVKPPTAIDEPYVLTFYSGEALLALLEYGESIKDPIVIRKALRTQDYYMHEYVENIAKNYYPAYVPWHTMSMAVAYHHAADRRYSNAVFIMTDKLLALLDTTKHYGRFFNEEFPEFGAAHSASDAVYTEGLATAYSIAISVGDKVREVRYRAALLSALGNLITLQYTDTDSVDPNRRRRAVGALRVREGRQTFRLDSSQHAIDAFQAALRALARNDGGDHE